MNDFLQEHRRFLLALAVGALVYVIGHLLLGAIYAPSIRRHRTAIRNAETELRKSLPTGVDLSRVKREREGVERAYQALESALNRIPTEGFVLTDLMPDPDLHYNRMVDEIRRGQLERCAIRNIDVDQGLGLPDTFPTTRREFDWYLRGLDVVRQLLDRVLAIDAEVLEGSIARIDRIQIKGLPKTRPSTLSSSPFLTRHLVDFVIVGHPRGIGALLDALGREEKEGQNLVLDAAVVRSLDLPPGSASRTGRPVDPLDQGRVEVRLTLGAIMVNPEGKVEAAGRSGP